MEYNKNKAKGYTLPYDTPYQQHMKKVKDITSAVSHALSAQILLLPRYSMVKTEGAMLHSMVCYVIYYAAEIQRGVWEEQSPDQHGPWGSWDPCCQGGLQEHHQCKCLKLPNQENMFFFSLWKSDTLDIMLFFPGSSLTTRRNTRPPRTSGSGHRTDQTSSTLPRIPCNRVM